MSKVFFFFFQSGNCIKHWKGLFSMDSCLLHLHFIPCSLLNLTLYNHFIYYELYNKNIVIFSPQLCIQRLSGLRLLHGGHSDGVQWTFCPQRRSQLSVGGLHWKNPLPSSRNSEFHTLMNQNTNNKMDYWHIGVVKLI